MAAVSDVLREWGGVKVIAAPGGTATTTRLRTSLADDAVLTAVAEHVSKIRRRDLAERTRAPGDPVSKARRKREMTPAASSRWAGTIMRGNDAQYQLARRAQRADMRSLRAGIAAITARLAQPVVTAGSGAPAPVERRRVKGYRSLAERYGKQERLQVLQGRLVRVAVDYAAGHVHVVAGGKRLLKVRANLDLAGLSVEQWREQWTASRDRIEANGGRDEPFGNLTLTVTPAGEVSIRLPRPLEHLANAPRGRYTLSGTASFAHRGGEWAAQITTPGAVAYTLARKAGRDGWYLTASWTTTAPQPPADDVLTGGALGVDLNADHLAVRRLDAHGNPVGAPIRIDLDVTGTSARRDAQVRHAITQLLHLAARYKVPAIAVEDLNFADARETGREMMGRGARGKLFRRTVAGIPTAVFRDRLAAMAATAGVTVFAVNPAYTSQWGGQHWRKPYGITRHEAAATVIGRRAQGHKARRRVGVTRARPEDRTARATTQAVPAPVGITDGHHRNGTGATKAPGPHRSSTRPPGRATVTPAQLTNNGQLLP
ncbi:transposase, IS605 OrfB family, central region [Sanguibacter gelidistatuariae]|uniref:Transposase, IS605 OrfB family, central region n=1 Tax=Sanguibacter gelidistatuariae TaxID=1814289 RepID=A0A1G6N810_9MICO|nr:hypothetical protein [Sanguibacter gelidistatuariae]SDC63968.1 transposase, IS605 OrfB family, central region [Sanguibacter gelidistatuariae]